MKWLGLALVVLLSLAPLSMVHAVLIGQVDDFEAGTTAAWGNGGGAPDPLNINTGGPAGANDNFLQITSNSNGIGAASRLTVFNRSQWLGNYIVAGVNEIDLDLRNLGTTTLSIRLAFKSSTAMGASGYITSSAIILAPNSGWQHAVFLIDPANMTAVGGPSAFNTFFANPQELRIINEVGTGDLNGDPIAGQLGVDNIRAVPEPTIPALLAFACVGLCIRSGPRSRCAANSS